MANNGIKKTTASRLDILEYKVDELTGLAKDTNNKLDGFQFPSQADFDAYKKEVKETYMTKEEFRPYGWVTKTIGGAFLGAIATAVAYFIIKGGLGG